MGVEIFNPPPHTHTHTEIEKVYLFETFPVYFIENAPDEKVPLICFIIFYETNRYDSPIFFFLIIIYLCTKNLFEYTYI